MKNIVGSKRGILHNKKALLIGLIFGVICFLGPVMAHAYSTNGIVNVTATVNGPSPSVAASIDSPISGQTFSTSPVDVIGSCPQVGLVIKIIDNGNFVGSAICKSDGSFSLKIDLTVGENVLVAQEYDSSNQRGPDSAPVVIAFSPVTPISHNGLPYSTNNTIATTIPRLKISLDASQSGYTGCSTGQQLSLPFQIMGGTPPYAIHIAWGNGENTLISLKNADESLIASHTYTKPGIYEVETSATDANGQTAILDVVVIINGNPQASASNTNSVLPTDGYNVPIYQWIMFLLLPLGYLLGRAKLRNKLPTTLRSGY